LERFFSGFGIDCPCLCGCIDVFSCIYRSFSFRTRDKHESKVASMASTFHLIGEMTAYFFFRYALQSTLRIFIAYIVSLLFALIYAYIAYKVEFAAQFLLLVLDILQSIPLLSFLPGVVLGIIYLFPGQRIGEEIAAILLLFTSMAWNIVFCFYQSLCGIPKDLHEAAEIFRLNPWKRFWLLELPSGAISLVWNSIISVAGGWFFLISIESFTLGNQDFRIPGLGSFLAVAANEGNFRSIWFGLATIILVIVILNYLIWW